MMICQKVVSVAPMAAHDIMSSVAISHRSGRIPCP